MGADAQDHASAAAEMIARVRDIVDQHGQQFDHALAIMALERVEMVLDAGHSSHIPQVWNTWWGVGVLTCKLI